MDGKYNIPSDVITMSMSLSVDKDFPTLSSNWRYTPQNVL